MVDLIDVPEARELRPGKAFCPSVGSDLLLVGGLALQRLAKFVKWVIRVELGVKPDYPGILTPGFSPIRHMAVRNTRCVLGRLV